MVWKYIAYQQAELRGSRGCCHPGGTYTSAAFRRSPGPTFWHLDACGVSDGICVCEGSLPSGACDGPISLIDKMGEASQTAMSPRSAFI